MENSTTLKIFKTFCEDNGLNFEEEFEYLLFLLNYSSPSEFKNYYDKWDKIGPNCLSLPKNKPYKRQFFLMATFLHHVYKIPFAYFGISDELTDKELMVTMNTKIGSKKYRFLQSTRFKRRFLANTDMASLTGNEIINLDFSSSNQYEAAFKRMAPLFENMKSSLHIYNYLEKRSFMQLNSTPYLNPNMGFYELIEDKLKVNKDFKYVRFLSLPQDHELKGEKYDSVNRNTQYELLLASILNLCPVPLFFHICKTLHLYGKQLEESGGGFYLVEDCIANYSYGTIDKDKVFLTEFTKYESGIPYPDYLDVQHPHGKLNQQQIKYIQSFDKMQYQPIANRRINPKFDFDKIIELLQSKSYNEIEVARIKKKVLDQDPFNPEMEFAKVNRDITRRKIEIIEKKEYERI